MPVVHRQDETLGDAGSHGQYVPDESKSETYLLKEYEMVTGHKSTIHQAVVSLIVRTGTGRIEAECQWDNVYSTQYDQAAPGRKVTWKIGAYDFEFTKVAKS